MSPPSPIHLLLLLKLQNIIATTPNHSHHYHIYQCHLHKTATISNQITPTPKPGYHCATQRHHPIHHPEVFFNMRNNSNTISRVHAIKGRSYIYFISLQNNYHKFLHEKHMKLFQNTCTGWLHDTVRSYHLSWFHNFTDELVSITLKFALYKRKPKHYVCFCNYIFLGL